MRMENEKNPWRALARKAVRSKAAEATRARELDAVVRELHSKLTAAESERDALEKTAAEIVGARDEVVANVKGWCDSYYRGRFSAMDTIGGIAALVGGNAFADTSVLERRRTAENVHVLMLMSEASTRLGEIETLLHDKGVPNTESQVQQVREVVAQRDAAEDDKHRLWGMMLLLLPRLKADEELREIFAREDYAGLEDYLESTDA